ncbi:trypsin-like peptidase domain-containing protein [Spongiactinospora sp. 9N601]|uniref:trypsin-like peptidase domain-containing protein n=1 Tax=Spongiactinospora sp. 9N601 TaxID=3375149 RepID=UPI00379AF271
MRPWLVRVRRGERPCGAGVLVDDRHIVTCAHVVNDALRRHARASEHPAETVEVDFAAFAGQGVIEAKVTDDGWFPITTGERGDVAVLRLLSPPPRDASPASLSRDVQRGTPIRAYGYPPGMDLGVWATGYEVGDRGGAEWIQLDAIRVTGRRIEHGFSGTPVEDERTGHVLGIVVAEDVEETAKVAWMLPLGEIDAHWPGLRAAALPSELAALLRRVRQVTDELPYKPSGPRGRRALSTVYVRQSAAALEETRRMREDGTPDDGPPSVEDLRVSGLAQPFEQIFGQHDHLVLEGAAGLGKTTLGNTLAGRLAEGLLSRAPAADALVPVVIPARRLAFHMNLSWADALATAVAEEYGRLAGGPLNAARFTRPVDGLRWLVVVDALDEVPDQSDRETLLYALADQMADPDAPARLVITTRPLPPGEVERLRGARIGLYELQPFDEEALTKFARNWFDPGGTPAGDRAAQEFLEQVRLAGLDSILNVPLLATVAALVFESRRSLPASRYELYEECIERFAEARREARAAALPDDGALAHRLEERRANLMERLAVAYTSTERPLPAVAREMLAEEMPSPGGWEQEIEEWLVQTGIIRRVGTRLEFIHQTFAEHLAANADAKALPPFHPGDQEWEDLLIRFRLGEEKAGRVLVHHLHRSGHDGAVLDHLQGGTRDDMELAGKLIAQGVPCGEGQRRAYLAWITDRLLTGGKPDLQPMAGLIRHQDVRAWLERLLSHPDVAPAAKVVMIDLLRERSEIARQDVLSLLTSLATDNGAPDVRIAAATVLAKYGEPHRTRAAEALADLANRLHGEDDVRQDAAIELANLGGDHRVRAADALQHMADNTSQDLWKRLDRARELAKIDDAGRLRAGAALRRMAEEASAHVDSRCHAAVELAKLGGDHRRQANEILARMAASSRLMATARLEIWTARAKIDPACRGEAAAVLRDIAVDPANSFWDRAEAAQALADLGAEHRAIAADVLESLIADPRHHDSRSFISVMHLSNLGERFHDRVASALYSSIVTQRSQGYNLEAAEKLIELGPGHRDRAADALRRLSADPVLSADDRFEAAQMLAQMGAGHRSHAAEALGDIAAMPAVAPSLRGLAALELAKLGPEHRMSVLALMGDLLHDSFSAQPDRITAARVMATLQPEASPLASLVVQAIARHPGTEPSARLQAAEALLELGPRYRAKAIDALVQVVADPLTDIRGTAIQTVADLAGEHSEQIAESLGRVATDPTVAPRNRLTAAMHLAYLGPEDESRRAALDAVAADPLTAPFTRWQALEALGWFDPADRDAAAGEATATCLGPGIKSQDRASIIDSLIEWGDDHIPRAAEILTALMGSAIGTYTRAGCAQQLITIGADDERVFEVIADDAAHTTRDFESRRLAEVVAALGDAQHDRFAALLRGLAADPERSAPLRRTAAERLADLGGHHRAIAVEQLHELGRQPEGRAGRARTLVSLWRYDPEAREHAIEELTQIITTPAPPPSEDTSALLGAAQHVAAAGRGHRDQAARTMAAWVTTAEVSSWFRRDAAMALAGFGPEQQSMASDALARASALPSLHPEDRLDAAEPAAQLGSPDHEPPGRALLALCTAAGIDPFTRRRAATSLARLGPGLLDRALAVLRDLGDDADDWNRLWSAEALMELGPRAREAAAGVLTRLTADTKAGRLHRALAAAALTCLEQLSDHHAAEGLATLATDCSARGWDRLQAVEALLRLNPALRERGGRLLGDLTDDARLRPWERRQAADLLARLGPGHRAQAARRLAVLAEETSADPWERAEAALAAAELDPGCRARSAGLIEMIAEDPDISPAQRRYAAMTLARFGPSAAERAAEALRAISTDGRVAAVERRRAGNDLTELGLAWVGQATESLRLVAADGSTPPADRRDAVRRLARFGGERRRGALRVLEEMAEDPSLDAADRTLAALEIADIGERNWPGAAQQLARLARDTTATPKYRRAAAEALADLDDEHRTEATLVLKDLLEEADPVHVAATHISLAALDATHRLAAAGALHRSAIDPSIDHDARTKIAESLAGLGYQHTHAAIEILRELAVDPGTDSDGRFAAADALGRIVNSTGRVKELRPRPAPED